MDLATNAKSSFVYGPYGELLASEAGVSFAYLRRFNNKYRDAATGLHYYGARYFDGLALTWTQADPLYRFAPDRGASAPRMANMYTFSLGGPLRFIDPDGQESRFWSTLKKAATINYKLHASTISAVQEGYSYLNGRQSGVSAARHVASDCVRSGGPLAGRAGPLTGLIADAIDDRDSGVPLEMLLEPPVRSGVQSTGAAGGGGSGRGISAFSRRWARREAMRQAGIPTSQQPTKQQSVTGWTKEGKQYAGRQYEYEVPAPGGGTRKASVQHSLTDDDHDPHWEAGAVKIKGQTDGVCRPRLVSDKAKVYDPKKEK